ncbi:MAG: DUF3048 domain-containing protein [Bacillota bacterium]
MKNKLRICANIAMLFIAFAIFSGCASTPGGLSPTSSPTDNSQQTTDPSVIPSPTGSPIPTPPNGFVLPRGGVRPIAVMIDNQGKRPLPQGGLNKAQIIYECLAEGGITRLMPVFWGNMPEMVGPVRSARDYFVQFAIEHDSIYVHIGWSPQAKALIPRLGVADVNGLYDSAFWKITNDRNNWQDKYTSFDKVMKIVASRGYANTTTKDLTFKYNSVMTPLSGSSTKSAKKIGINYNFQADNRYEYDSATKLYLRYRNGKKHMERVSGKQLSAGNIIVQYVSNSTIADDHKNRQELNNIGSGKGWYITCGKAVEIRWSKSGETSKTRYTYLNGGDLVLNPAQTWIQVVPPSRPVSIK